MVLSTLKNIRGKVQDYVQDKAMDHLLRNTIIYNVAWEDPRVDGKVLKLGPEDRLLMLTTGGCNVMDRLLDGVAHIVSVDLNPSQNALLELRLAAARSCTHEQFFQLFAHSNRRLFDALYPQNLRPLLSPSAQAFWDDNQGNFFDDFFYAGASGGLARILCWLTWLLGLQPLVRALLTCRTVEDQRKLLDTHQTKLDRLIRLFDALLPAFCPLAGVPASQLRLVTGDDNKPVSIVKLFLDRIFRQTHIAADNYFYYGYLFGKYSRQCCPRYLRPENFEQLKNAASRVTVKTTLLHEAAMEYPDGYFTGMILLDHMDWLSPEQIQSEWAVFCKKLNPETGRVLWRSFAQTQRWPMLKFLNFDVAGVAQAEAETPDRVGMYNSTHLGRLPAGVSICEPLSPAQPAADARTRDWHATFRGVLAVVQLVPLFGRLVAAILSALVSFFVTSFAQSVAPAPEGRRTLLSILPGVADGVWVDLGGGLIDGLRESADEGSAASTYAQVHAVAFGKEGVKTTGLGFRSNSLKKLRPGAVRLHEHTINRSIDALKAVPETIGVSAGTADVVTISHALVSEKEWEERLALAHALLKPGGHLAVTDLATPAAPSDGVLSRALSAMRTAFWSAARARGAAPHHAAVMGSLRNSTSEVHYEVTPARASPRAPLSAAHFVYVGKSA